MAKVRMRDMVVVLPGITGSVLQRDGKDLWAMSGQAAWGILTSLGSSLQRLKLAGDDPNAEDLGDGITATRLIPDAHLVPGLVKIDGYSALSRFITDNFEVIRGSAAHNKAANFFEFPYDWRRDNRVSARRLKRLIDQRLPQWRQHSGAADAKVILLAHSMGGLVSRYYLEVLEGWRDCKALVTFGTPYRGSANALDYLVNGYKKMFIDLTEMMRSLTAVYQLLPIYPVIKVADTHQRVAETEGIPGVDQARAKQALMFHREIETAVNTHLTVTQYREEGYKTVPMVGTRQPTFQSAQLSGGHLTVSRELPTGIDALLGDGDGTVPYLSAIPIELSDEYRDSFVAERHGSLQNNAQVLNDLLDRLKRMQIRNLGSIRGAVISAEAAGRAAISLDLDDLYLAGEPVTLRARLINPREGLEGLKARIGPAAAAGATVESEFRPDGDEWALTVNTLPAGLYRVEVRTRTSGPQAPTPVHDLFEVVR